MEACEATYIMHGIIYQQGQEKDGFMSWTWHHKNTERQEAWETTKKDSWESRVSTTGHNTLPHCNWHKNTLYPQFRIAIVNSHCMTRCAKWKKPQASVKKKKKKVKCGYGMAASKRSEVIWVLTLWEESQKRGDRCTLCTIWFAHILRPLCCENR